ncbi:MAG: beta-phosphoglucomutase [Cyclobacteriaceae bacterium]|nr:beta-phosphoglucomutase [Cyclobacteriaceae bacterium]UYN88430.1 MAG: beta-phosphoglucomutase [Cyclobacteriaceae bacterium]
MTACIFDLDGVIVDTAHYHFMAWQRLARELGIELTPHDNERLKGVGRIESLNIILEIGGISLPDDEKERLAAKKNTWFVEYIQAMKKEEIFPGAKALFDSLHAHNIKVGLASSSKNARTVLHKLEIESIFEAIVDGTMITNSKPDPEIFLKASSLLKVYPAECIVIEDAEAGVEAALRAGMRCVGIGKPQQLSKANFVVDHIQKLSYNILKNL